MSPVLIAYFAGMASAFGISTCFVIFAMWHNKRYPLMPKEPDEEILAAETMVQCPGLTVRRWVKP